MELWQERIRDRCLRSYENEFIEDYSDMKLVYSESSFHIAILSNVVTTKASYDKLWVEIFVQAGGYPILASLEDNIRREQNHMNLSEDSGIMGMGKINIIDVVKVGETIFVEYVCDFTERRFSEPLYTKHENVRCTMDYNYQKIMFMSLAEFMLLKI